MRMVQAVDARATALEHLRIGRLLDAHGDVIAAICAYSEVIRDGAEPAATAARRRIAELANSAEPRPSG